MRKNSCFNDIESILISEEEINRIIERISDDIDRDYRERVENGNRLLLLCILKGSVVFMGELMKRISLPVEIDFMKVSSYGKSTKSGGSINILLDLHRTDLPETDIIIIEDINEQTPNTDIETNSLALISFL